jgi:hypothetical protein
VESRLSRKRAAITRAKYRRDVISCNTIKPPSEDKRPASNVAASDLAPTGDRPGRNGVAGMAMSAGPATTPTLLLHQIPTATQRLRRRASTYTARPPE